LTIIAPSNPPTTTPSDYGKENRENLPLQQKTDNPGQYSSQHHPDTQSQKNGTVAPVRDFLRRLILSSFVVELPFQLL
jgi:hypothetical protein